MTSTIELHNSAGTPPKRDRLSPLAMLAQDLVDLMNRPEPPLMPTVISQGLYDAGKQLGFDMSGFVRAERMPMP